MLPSDYISVLNDKISKNNSKQCQTWFSFIAMSTTCSIFWNMHWLCNKSLDTIHLARLIPWRFLKPAVCKYSTTVNKSEINILFPKPYSLMWHLVRGNRVRNGHDRRPETRRMRSPKVALLKIPMDSVQYNTEHCGINDDPWWHGWWAQHLWIAETTCRVGIRCADLMNTCLSAW